MKAIITLLFFITMSQDNSFYLFDCKSNKNIDDWYVVNDGVMGGLSQGEIVLNDKGNALFKGQVTTENNGGFSSVRTKFIQKDVSEFEQVILEVRGDGKTYQFRIKDDASQRYSYIHDFKTSGEWEIVKIPFSSFYPSFRGNNLDKPNYLGNIMEGIALLIGNKRKERFSLEISKIYLK